MKVLKTLFSSLLVITFAITAGAQEKSSEQPAGAPRLVVESFTHDFGEIKSGTLLSYSFKIKNEGKADLLIKSVNPG